MVLCLSRECLVVVAVLHPRDESGMECYISVGPGCVRVV